MRLGGLVKIAPRTQHEDNSDRRRARWDRRIGLLYRATLAPEHGHRRGMDRAFNRTRTVSACLYCSDGPVPRVDLLETLSGATKLRHRR